MIEEKVNNTWRQADELYKSARQELARPEEDVVPYMVCRSAYKSVDKYLTGFLMKHGVEIHNSMTLETLLELCKDIDPRFDDLSIKPLMKKDATDDVWMNMDTVKDFIDIATRTKSLVGQS